MSFTTLKDLMKKKASSRRQSVNATPTYSFDPALPTLEPSDDIEVIAFADKAREFISNYVPFQGDDLFVAGGVFARLYHDIPVRDIDVYVKDEETFNKIRKEYLSAFGSVEPDYSKGTGYFQQMNDKFFKYKHSDEITVDFILFHEPKNVNYIQTFDFSVCKFAITETDAYCNAMDFNDLKHKIIQYTLGSFGKTSKGNSTLHRLIKYVKMGFEPDESYCLEWMMSDLMNKKVQNHSYYKGK
jgi:hypothetical protein